MLQKQIGIGVGLYLFNDEHQLLLGLRKSKHGEGTWCPPGGHLEYGESFEKAAVRETMEETGILAQEKDVSIGGVTNDFFEESGKHYVTIHLIASSFSGESKIMESDKCAQWQWFDLDKLPENIFLPAAHFLAQNPFNK